MMMNGLIRVVCIVGFFFSFTSVAIAETALVDTGDELIYVGVGAQQGDEHTVNHTYTSCRLFCSRTATSFRVASSDLIRPVATVTVETQGVLRNIGRDEVILGTDGNIYLVRDVFANGLIAAYRSDINPNSRNRVAGNIDAAEEDNIFILDVDDVQAVQVDCFLNVCTGQRYHEIAGMPLCDFERLRGVEVTEGVVTGVPSNLSCRVDRSAPIHAVFSDGTLANGNRLFNPFPSTINNYYRVTEAEELSEDSPSVF